MTGPTLEPVMVSERIASVDIVRGFALWGVLLINMMNHGALDTARWFGPLDRFAFWAQRFVFEQKSWRLFSFLFGFGFSLLLIRASARGARFLPMYVRRLIVLLGFGFFSFLFGPDIISVYAILGFGLLLFHHWSPRWLLLLAALLLLVNPIYTVVPKVPSGAVKNRAVVSQTVPAIINIPEKELAALAGLYVDPGSERSIRLYMKGAKLIVAWSNEPSHPVTADHVLSPVSQNRFLTGARNEVEIVFVRPTVGQSMQVKVIIGGQTTTLDPAQSMTPTSEAARAQNAARPDHSRNWDWVTATRSLYTHWRAQVREYRWHMDPRREGWRGDETWLLYFTMFLLGLYAGKRRIFQDYDRHRLLIRRIFFWGLPLGLLAMTTDWIFREFVSGRLPPAVRFSKEVVWAYGATALALSYAAGLVLLIQKPRWKRILFPLGAMGRMALTVYLTQSIIITTLFMQYGFDQNERVGPARVFGYAAIIYAVQLAICVWWVKRFRFGPAEWLWRTLTYLKLQPMRLPRSESAAATAPAEGAFR